MSGRRPRWPTRSVASLECQQFLAERLVELEMFDRRSTNLAHRLYDEALACRMRPFADGVAGLSAHGARPRRARSASRCSWRSSARRRRWTATSSRSSTRRSAICCATPSTTASNRRTSAAPPASRPKASCASRRATAPACCRSSSPTTAAASISSKLREAVVERELANAETAAQLSEAELLEFLFLPGFTMKDDGHRDLRPRRRPRRRAGHGQAGARHGARLVPARQGHALPPAAAAHALGGPHAARRDRRRAVRVSARLHRARRSSCRRSRSSCSKAASISTSTAGRSAWSRRTRCWTAASRPSPATSCRWSWSATSTTRYGLVVDRFLGERELVVQPLDPRLGKIKDIAPAR